MVAGIGLLLRHLYTPFPSNAREPRKLQVTFAFFKIINIICVIGEKFGYNRLNTRRYLQERMALRRQERDDESLKVKDTIIDGVKVRLYQPSTVIKESPALIYFHGGGWIFGSINTHDTVSRRIARSSNLIVISVEYRLAPEHIFPAAFDDCLAVTAFLLKHARTYGIDPSRIAVAGDSAGGNLAMAVCLKLSRDKETTSVPDVKIMGLLYPVLQGIDFNLPSYQLYSGNNEPSLITKTGMATVYNIYGLGNIDHIDDLMTNAHISQKTGASELPHYASTKYLPISRQIIHNNQSKRTNEELASRASELITNPYLSPLLVSDEELRKLPETYLATAEFDPLRDEGWILAKRLELIEHDLSHKDWPGVPHGFINFTSCKCSSEFVADFSKYLIKHL